MRESIGERRSLLRIAPHLVHPVPVVVPTYGHGPRGRAVLHAALLMHDLIGFRRNAGLASAQRIPRGRIVSRRECLTLAPGLDTADVTGAGVFHDGQVHSAERLVLAFLESSAKAGAELANYTEVTTLRHDRDGILRVDVCDHLTGERSTLRARAVVNAAGPWVEQVLQLAIPGAAPGVAFATAFNVVTRRLYREHAVALPVRDASGGATRRLFVVPWRDCSLVGTWYRPHDGRGRDARITEADVAELLAAVNRTCPALALTLDDVRMVHGGLLPTTGDGREAVDARLTRCGRIVDHARDGCPGLLSVVGVKLTTARLMAERTVDRVLDRLGRTRLPSMSAVVPLHGGDGATALLPDVRSPRARQVLARRIAHRGSAYGEVLAHLTSADDPQDELSILGAEVRHAIRTEMAQTLADIVFRRTELGTAGHPGARLLGAAARAAGAELGWSRERETAELREIHGHFGVPR
jgi:glycerol-3-phosphate dehydrogenase